MVIDCYGYAVLSCGLISPLTNGIKTSLVERRRKGALNRQVLDLPGLIDKARKYDDPVTLNILRYYRINSRDNPRGYHGSRIRRSALTASQHFSDGDGWGSDIRYGRIWLAGMICGLSCRGWIRNLDRRRGCTAT